MRKWDPEHALVITHASGQPELRCSCGAKGYTCLRCDPQVNAHCHVKEPKINGLCPECNEAIRCV